MGVLETKARGKHYYHELEMHGIKRSTELPVEQLNAVFLETSGFHPTNTQAIERLANEHGRFWYENPPKGTEKRINEILERAKQSGTEIWLGDTAGTSKEHSLNIAQFLGAAGIRGIIPAIAGATPGISIPLGFLCGLCSPHNLSSYLLSRKGSANNRSISRKYATLIGKIAPPSRMRDLVMAQKIVKLTRVTGHNKIGILTGAGHVGISDILEKEKALTEKQREKIAARSPDALKMYRCIYDKQAERWRIEEHSL